MANSSQTLVTEDLDAGTIPDAPSDANLEQVSGFHAPGNGNQPCSSTSSKIVPSNEPIMTDDQFEELQRQQLQQLLDQEELSAREKALK